ncbi:MAG: hypothetical protein US40_C0011G0034 [Candidatus Roizmanbacteria bacterium GW2011_GWC2_37_13]|uniref:Uncharacterized protein n=1 Tax=Candidatus Roizmanbacteria bacterium GW2011_GWC2_37_13 TaxID=1618486 RepID=A0A0G0ILS1_9BACT|nr:MAG: hypothetical protein US38_C0007G0034 [Candidatus Roizmanbacteria bacterium GW2011_GWC1_37_12]KKQ25149.1 MAG: hypothetical protein US40_C0011G0034 [Candidatus Roizmanbacteria bacterium GW2011_GWC2_37_13]
MTDQKKLKISTSILKEINDLLLDPKSQVVKNFFRVVGKYGTPQQINQKARSSGKLSNLIKKLKKVEPSYVKDLEWLMGERDRRAFVNVDDYRWSILGPKAKNLKFKDDLAVILEISALQYFPWLIAEARQAITRRELMPGRFIQVRNMKEQEEDGDLLAILAAMKIIGASLVETLDTKGTDGSNVHLGGPATITGYFGGIGQPNDHALNWLDEFLYYYTNYGVCEVLNINPGTILLGYLLYKIGVDINFKISVFMGNDNPYAAMWTLIGAKLFSRPDGSVPLIGFNWSNSINNETMEITAQVRKKFDLEHIVRFEHHIVEAYKSIVRQPYDRRDELMEVAKKVANISAKHEGGEVAVEKKREHQSDILDYFMAKKDVDAKKLMPALEQNYLDKHHSVNITAKALTKHGLSFVAAKALHY